MKSSVSKISPSVAKIGLPCLLMGALLGFYAGRNTVPQAAQLEGTAIPSLPGRNVAEPRADAIAGKSGRTEPGREQDFTSQVAAALENDPDGSGYLKLLERAVARGHPYAEASLLQALESMRASDGPGVHAFLDQLLRNHRHNLRPELVWHAFWRRLGSADPKAALALAEQDKLEWPMRDRLRKFLYSGWGERDPQAALTHVASDESLPDREMSAEGAALMWSHSDPRQATAWVLQNLTDKVQSSAMGAIQWGSIGSLGPGATVEALGQIPAGPTRDRALRALTEALVSLPQLTAEDRKSAVEQLRDQGVPAPDLLKSVGLDIMASGTPVQAAEYLTSFSPPPGSPHYYGFGQVMSRWAVSDAEAAGNWLNAQSGRPWYDSAVSGYVMGIRDTDPQAAEVWLGKIASPEVRAMVR